VIARMKLRTLVAISAVVILGAACGGGNDAALPTPSSSPPSPTPSPTPSPSPTCGPSSKTAVITARVDAVTGLPEWDKDCLAVPADTAFTITLDNQDAA
jgi:hypothetical protein